MKNQTQENRTPRPGNGNPAPQAASGRPGGQDPIGQSGQSQTGQPGHGQSQTGQSGQSQTGQSGQSQTGQSGQSQTSDGGASQQSHGLSARTHEVAEHAKSAAIEKVGAVRERAEEGFEHGREQVAERIERVSSALRATTDTLRRDDQLVARYADLATERVEQLASYVRASDLQAVVRDVESVARRQPVLFFGGAFAIGLLAGRFLKSSRSRDDARDELQQGSYRPRPGTYRP